MTRTTRNLALAALLIAAGTAAAQQGPPPGGAGGPPPNGAPQGAPPQGGGGDESRLQGIVKAVGLDAAQEAKAREVLKHTMEAIGAARGKYPAWNDEAKQAMDQVFKDEQASLEKLLTAQQLPKYRAHMQAWLDERAKDKH